MRNKNRERVISKEKKIEILLDVYNEQRERAKEYERSKDNYNYFIMILIVGLIAAIVQSSNAFFKCISSFIVILLPCYGIKYNEKMYERFELRLNRSRALREYIDKAYLNNLIKREFYFVDKKHDLKYLNRDKYSNTWNYMYYGTFVYGLALFIIELIGVLKWFGKIYP